MAGHPSEGFIVTNERRRPGSGDVERHCAAPPGSRCSAHHSVRHTLAQALQAGGVPDHEAAALLAHDTATYARFSLVTDDAGAAAAAAVAGTLFAAG